MLPDTSSSRTSRRGRSTGDPPGPPDRDPAGSHVAPEGAAAGPGGPGTAAGWAGCAATARSSAVIPRAEISRWASAHSAAREGGQVLVAQDLDRRVAHGRARRLAGLSPSPSPGSSPSSSASARVTGASAAAARLAAAGAVLPVGGEDPVVDRMSSGRRTSVARPAQYTGLASIQADPGQGFRVQDDRARSAPTGRWPATTAGETGHDPSPSGQPARPGSRHPAAGRPGPARRCPRPGPGPGPPGT